MGLIVISMIMNDNNFHKKFDEAPFEFSIIMPFFDVEKYLGEAIESILNQTIGFEDNVQLILINDGCTDNSMHVALEYEKSYPNNIYVLSQENSGQACGRNLGLKHVLGKYVNFLDSDDYLSENTLQEVHDFFEKHGDEIDLVAIPMILFGRNSGDHRLNYKFEKSRVIDLKGDPDNPQMSSSSTFIKSEALVDMEFDERLISAEDAVLVNKILLKKMKYGVLSTSFYYYRQRYVKNSTIDTMTSKKEYYTDRLKYFFKELIDYSLDLYGNVPLFIQYMLVYDLHWMLEVPDLDFFENQNEVTEFGYYLLYVIQYLDTNVILQSRNIGKSIKPFFRFLKNKQYSVEIIDEKLFLKIGVGTIDNLNNHTIWMDIVEIRNGFLNLLGQLTSIFDEKYLEIKLVKTNLKTNNTEYIPGKKVYYSHPVRNKTRYLSVDWKFVNNFEFNIPVDNLKDSKLSFEVKYSENNNDLTLDIRVDFASFAGLSSSSIYFIKDSKMVVFKDNSFYILNYSYDKMLRYEYSSIKKIISDRQNYWLNAIFIRIAYLIIYPFIRNKKIWLFEDRLDFADDNAKQLFDYSMNQNDGIKKYFVIGGDSPDYSVMKKQYKNVLKFQSLKHKFLFLIAKKNISSYVNEDFINPFYDCNKYLYAGLISSEDYFLQHGVTKDDVSYYIKRFDKKLSLIVTVSELEKKSFLSEGYNFGEDIVQVLGFPRYDKLSNKNKKQILFAPTWRLQIHDEESLISSEYYESLTGILNNPVLMDFLSENGYTLKFKPHPELIKYLDKIPVGENVEISVNESYSKLFGESSILITDFSSVYFDFAYLKKPVIYYQPNDDYHYDEGYFDYETMGFGEVIVSESKLFDKIKYYFLNDFQMEDVYLERVECFFKYTDRNNCKRVYEWIKNN